MRHMVGESLLRSYIKSLVTEAVENNLKIDWDFSGDEGAWTLEWQIEGSVTIDGKAHSIEEWHRNTPGGSHTFNDLDELVDVMASSGWITVDGDEKKIDDEDAKRLMSAVKDASKQRFTELCKEYNRHVAEEARRG